MVDQEKMLKEADINELIGAILILDLSNVDFSVEEERAMMLSELMTRDPAEVLNTMFTVICEVHTSS